MPLKKSNTKPTLSEMKRAAEKKQKKPGKGIDPTRQRKSSRNGGALKASKKVVLSGDERYFIQETIRKIKPASARTAMEKRLLRKVSP